MTPVAAFADVGPAMTDPVVGTQACFRALLDAMAHPGRIVTLPRPSLDGIDGPLTPAVSALLLTLLDPETSIRLHGRFDADAVRAWLRFHTGVREAWLGAGTDFTAVPAAHATPLVWSALDLGTDEEPERGSTLVVEVALLSNDAGASPADRRHAVELRGPGIDDRAHLLVGGLPLDFWRYRIAMQSRFPRGFELVLCCGSRIAALPRTTRVQLLEG